jgi:hypothetical protein
MRIIVTAILGLSTTLMAQNPTDSVTPIGGSVAISGALGARTFAFIGGQLADGATMTMVGGNAITGAPYSAVATTQRTQTLADGSHIVQNSSANLYRDSQGRERRQDFPKLGATDGAQVPQDGAQMVFISDPVAGANYMLHPKSRTAHRVPALPRVLGSTQTAGGANALYVNGMRVSAGMLPPPPAGVQPVTIMKRNGSVNDVPAPRIEQLGSSTIEGVEAEGTRSTVTIPAGQAGNDRELQIVDERWYSPDLKVTVLSRHSDPRVGETVYRLTQINRGEPLPSMFEVPADYKITDGPGIESETIQTK